MCTSRALTSADASALKAVSTAPVLAVRAASRALATPPMEVNVPPTYSRLPSVASERTVLSAPGFHVVTGAPVSAFTSAIRERATVTPAGDFSPVNVPPSAMFDPTRTIAKTCPPVTVQVSRACSL